MEKSSKKVIDVLMEIDRKRGLQKQVDEAQKIRFLHRIIQKYNDQKSFMLWQKIVKTIPLLILQEVENNIDQLKRTGYPLKNQAGFFISTLKKMGYHIGRGEEVKA